MAGYEPRGTNANRSLFTKLSDVLRNISKIGMKYDDMIFRRSMSVGITEATFTTGPNLPEPIRQTLALQDFGQRKFQVFFDKDYPSRRNFLRQFSMSGEIEWILDTISDDAIEYDDQNYFAYPNTSKVESILNDDIKEKFIEDMRLTYNRFYNWFFGEDISSWHYFRQFLIDGFLAFEIIIDDKEQNIIGFKEIDPPSIRMQVEKNNEGKLIKAWYQYEEQPDLFRIIPDSNIIYISYAKGNYTGRLSYVERLVREFNLLRIMEHSRVIWNIMNSTFRLKMVVPIGDLSGPKAKETLGELLNAYKEEIHIDSNSGEVFYDGRAAMPFYKNYMFPTRDGEQVDISSISFDGPDLSDTNALMYFKEKLMIASKIPFGRWERQGGGGSMIYDASGLDHEEMRYAKFIKRLRSIFQEILTKPLRLAMCLKYPQFIDDELLVSNIGITYVQNNYIEATREQERLAKNISFINDMKQLRMDDDTTPYFGTDFLIETYLGLSPELIAKNRKIIETAKANAQSGEDGKDGDNNSWMNQSGQEDDAVNTPSW